MDDSFNVGTDQECWYKEPNQGTVEDMPSTSNLDPIVVIEDAQSPITPSPDSPQPSLPPGKFDCDPGGFEDVGQDDAVWPEDEDSPTANYQ